MSEVLSNVKTTILNLRYDTKSNVDTLCCDEASGGAGMQAKQRWQLGSIADSTGKL